MSPKAGKNIRFVMDINAGRLNPREWKAPGPWV